MSGILFTTPRWTPVNNDGVPRAAARLYFYQAGTSTACSVYTTAALSAAHSHPVIANAFGAFPAIYLDPDSGFDYKAVLTDSAGVQLWSEDNIPRSPALAASVIGAAIWPTSDSEASGGVTPTDYAYPWGDLRRYGGDATGMADSSTAFTSAVASGHTIIVPDGTFILDQVTADGVIVTGTGTLKKKSSTAGKMLELTGDNVFEGITIDQNWPNITDAVSYSTKVAVWQEAGSLTVRNCTFTNSLFAAIRIQGGSLHVAHCQFKNGAPHNGLSGGSERVTQYIYVDATSTIADTAHVNISNNDFLGPNAADSETYYLNPAAIFINADEVDGARYKCIAIHGNTIEACGLNSGPGNFTAPIDTYNGVENLSITGNTIRKFSYAGIKVQNSSNVTITGNVIEDGHSGASAYDPGKSFGILVQEKQRGATTEQYRATVVGNVLDGCSYCGILNSVDHAVIADNVVNDVADDSGTGTGIWNTGSHVKVSGNVVKAHEGYGIYSTGDDVTIEGNSTINADTTNDYSVFFSGNRLTITGNNISNASGTPTNPGIRTNGPASDLLIGGNVFNNLSKGIEVAVSGGAVDNLRIERNLFNSVTTSYVIAAAATNVSADTTGATSVADGGTVTHGHPVTPTGVRVTPSTTGEFASVTTMTATTFTVAIKKHDNSAGTTQTVYWHASS